MENSNKATVLETLGKNIRQLRLLKGLSQENLASDLQKSINFVSLVENGKTGMSIQTLVDICNVLSVNANALFNNIIIQTEDNNSFDVNSLNLFEGEDKKIVNELIHYIVNSKR